MKYIHTLLFFALVSVGITKAQIKADVNTWNKQQPLKTIYLNKDVSTHVISPELIQTVDISTNKVQGDLPIKNILRLKPVNEDGPLGILTVIGQRYIAQFNLAYADMSSADKEITILPEDMKSLDHPDFRLSSDDLYKLSMQALSKKPAFHNVKSAAYGMKAELNNIYTIGDYFLVDITFCNKTNIQYDVDQLRFKIEDKKIVKATNEQFVEVHPEYTLYDHAYFKKRNRNIFVFKKFTFPGDKVFTVELAEKQISGRIIYLQIDYTDVLNADSL